MGRTVFLMENVSQKASLVFRVKADPCIGELVEELQLVEEPLHTDSWQM